MMNLDAPIGYGGTPGTQREVGQQERHGAMASQRSNEAIK